ncbi:MAG: DUF1697 domain-containing protein [Verrucomicrobiaceae bacterium]|nr:MAG: DUF1697 domain-containing protein [Verrucomicrobiaceae bacterium]
MTAYVALLRAVNVGGTGKLPMEDLRQLCEDCGFAGAKTYIASGNVVFKSAKSEKQVKAVLEKALATYAGKPVGVLVRTEEEMKAVIAKNPFPDAPGNRSLAIFLDDAPPKDLMETLKGQKNEQVKPGKREIHVLYDEGMGTSKLVVPAAKTGTARNMNTVAKLAGMAAEI